MTHQPSSADTARPASIFATTQWTQVLGSQGGSAEAREHLSALCAAYYTPVIVFLRSEGRPEDDAREIAHEFFAHILERHALDGADPARGRFRSYLLGALKHFLANRRARHQSEKRGGKAVHQSLFIESETSTAIHLPDPSALPPDAAFDREWAFKILERALQSLKAECDSAHFETLKPWLLGESAPPPQAETARQLGMNEPALRVAIHRLRRRFRDHLKSEIIRTLRDPSDAAEELRHLLRALA